jgi:hypothetical protein
MSPQDRDNAVATLGAVWSGVAHQAGTANGAGGLFPGWTPASRAALNQVRDGRGGLANRNGLPPHRYLQIPAGAPTPAQVAYLRNSYWVNDLQHPSDGGFGVVALAPLAAASWANGKKVDALVAQITHGATSIEVYYLGSKEMF